MLILVSGNLIAYVYTAHCQYGHLVRLGIFSLKILFKNEKLISFSKSKSLQTRLVKNLL